MAKGRCKIVIDIKDQNGLFDPQADESCAAARLHSSARGNPPSSSGEVMPGLDKVALMKYSAPRKDQPTKSTSSGNSSGVSVGWARGVADRATRNGEKIPPFKPRAAHSGDGQDRNPTRSSIVTGPPFP